MFSMVFDMTLRRGLWFWAGRVAQKMNKFRWDCLSLLVLLKSLGIESHETRLIHVRQKHWFVGFGDILQICVMLPMLAELMGEVTLFPMQTEVKADFILELAFFRKGFDRGSSLLDMKEAHLEALVGKLLS
jgi:hypothetical protein